MEFQNTIRYKISCRNLYKSLIDNPLTRQWELIKNIIINKKLLIIFRTLDLPVKSDIMKISTKERLCEAKITTVHILLTCEADYRQQKEQEPESGGLKT